MLDLANAVRLVLVSLVVALVFGPSEAGMLKESGVLEESGVMPIFVP
jgi:hypothetical protein